MVGNPIDASSTLSLLGSVDLYWKSQQLVDYFKDLYTYMMLDDQVHEEGDLIHKGVIYHHDRIFFPRASNLKDRMLQRALKEFYFNPTYSMKIYNTIMRCFEGEGFGGELH